MRLKTKWTIAYAPNNPQTLPSSKYTMGNLTSGKQDRLLSRLTTKLSDECPSTNVRIAERVAGPRYRVGHSMSYGALSVAKWSEDPRPTGLELNLKCQFLTRNPLNNETRIDSK